ncbi:MAG: site-2 protease family protein [Patescibacteria group bacterium]|nr:site-2 protease family protein [Patescibacteria group bacterium]
MNIVIFILFLVGLILVHELGHLGVAKLFNTRVDEFSVGFGPRLFGFVLGETQYNFKPILLGGYVRIWGEAGEDVSGDPRAFSNKPRLIQGLVALAGVAANFLLAIIIVTGGYMAGMPTATSQSTVAPVANARATIEATIPGSPAERAGLSAGDVIVGIETGTSKLVRGADAAVVQQFIADHADESIVFHVLRNGSEQTFLAKGEEGIVDGRKAVGIELADVGILKLPVHLAFAQGTLVSYEMFVDAARGFGAFLGQLVRGSADLSAIAGPIGIVQLGSSAVSAGAAAVIVLVAFISINLVLINLLPVPGLDGGRLLIIVIEAVRRKPLPTTATSIATLAGLGLIILLVLLVSAHDIARLIG